jgi:hypothetical protein
MIGQPLQLRDQTKSKPRCAIQPIKGGGRPELAASVED